MTRPPRSPRRAYDADGREISPMTLANMREQGSGPSRAHCQGTGCGHAGSMNVDHLPDDLPVPGVALRLSMLGVWLEHVKTIPHWREGQWARDYAKGSWRLEDGRREVLGLTSTCDLAIDATQANASRVGRIIRPPLPFSARSLFPGCYDFLRN